MFVYKVSLNGKKQVELTREQVIATLVDVDDICSGLLKELNNQKVEIFGAYFRFGDIAETMREGMISDYASTIYENMLMELEVLLDHENKFTFYDYLVEKVDLGPTDKVALQILDTQVKANVIENQGELDEPMTVKDFLIKANRLKDFMSGGYTILDLNERLIQAGMLPIPNKYSMNAGKYFTFDMIKEKALEENIPLNFYIETFYMGDMISTGESFNEWARRLQSVK